MSWRSASQPNVWPTGTTLSRHVVQRSATSAAPRSAAPGTARSVVTYVTTAHRCAGVRSANPVIAVPCTPTVMIRYISEGVTSAIKARSPSAGGGGVIPTAAKPRPSPASPWQEAQRLA